MKEKWCVGGAREQVCPESAAVGALAKKSHKGETVELLLEVSNNSSDRRRHCRKMERAVPWYRLEGTRHVCEDRLMVGWQQGDMGVAGKERG